MKTLERTSIITTACVCLALGLARNGSCQNAAQPAAATSAAAAEKAIVPASRTELFNGKDLAGWAFCLRSNAEPSQTWSVKDGVIHCTGQPYGYMRTAANYRDYKLTVEWRFVKPAPKADNSGIFVHLQPPDNVWPKCIEIQGQFKSQGNLILMGGTAVNGQEPTPAIKSVRSKEPSNEKPAGEWNTCEIIAAGDALKVSINGKLMNEVAGCSVTSGSIAIQSEGGEWEARKVYLEPVRVP